MFVFIVAMSGGGSAPQARCRPQPLGPPPPPPPPGLTLIVPFVDRVKPLLDLREQVVSFPPQPVITEDNLVVGIDTVIYFTITDPKAATYEVANPLQAIEQLTVTTLRNVIGGLTLEETLTSRDNVNSQLRVVSTRRPASGASASTASSSSRSSRRARSRRRWRSRCAPSATAARRSYRRGYQAVADSHGGGREAGRGAQGRGRPHVGDPEAEGEAKAIDTVFKAIHEGAPDQQLLRTSTCRCCRSSPRVRRTRSWSSVGVLPALENIGGAIGSAAKEGAGRTATPRRAAGDHLDPTGSTRRPRPTPRGVARGGSGGGRGRGRILVGHAPGRGHDPARPGREPRPGHGVPRVGRPGDPARRTAAEWGA